MEKIECREVFDISYWKIPWKYDSCSAYAYKNTAFAGADKSTRRCSQASAGALLEPLKHIEKKYLNMVCHGVRANS